MKTIPLGYRTMTAVELLTLEHGQPLKLWATTDGSNAIPMNATVYGYDRALQVVEVMLNRSKHIVALVVAMPPNSEASHPFAYIDPMAQDIEPWQTSEDGEFVAVVEEGRIVHHIEPKKEVA